MGTYGVPRCLFDIYPLGNIGSLPGVHDDKLRLGQDRARTQADVNLCFDRLIDIFVRARLRLDVPWTAQPQLGMVL